MNKDTRLHVTLTEAERTALRAFAHDMEMSMGSLARLAIRALLRNGVTIPGFTPPAKK